MIISLSGNNYVSSKLYAEEDIRAVFEQECERIYNEGYDNGKLEAEEKCKLGVTAESQYDYDKGYEDGKSFGINLGKDDTVFQKQWVDKEKKSSYERGYHDGYKVCDEEKGNSFNSGYNQGCNDASEGFELRKSVLNKEYVKGKTEGYNEGYQHGFTLAKEKITELDKSDLQKQYNKGFEKGSDYVREYTKQNELLQNNREEDIQKLSFNDGYQVGKKEGYESGYADCSQKLYSIFGERELEIEKDSYQEGYAQAYSELHAPTTERERQLQEKAWDEGYLQGESDMLETVNELSAQQAEDWNNEELSEETTVEDKVKDNIEEMSQYLSEITQKERKHNHYFKDTSKFDEIDTYLLARIWGIEDKNGAYFHAFKKVLDAGKRGNKGKFKDIGEAIDSLKRYLEIEKMFEDKGND